MASGSRTMSVPKCAKKLDGHKHPTAGCLDSQSVKTVGVSSCFGYDAGKKVKGRKRHILVDTLGLLLVVMVTVADIQDRDGAKLLFGKLSGALQETPRPFGWMAVIAARCPVWVKVNFKFVLAVVLRSEEQKGFVGTAASVGRGKNFCVAQSSKAIIEGLRSFSENKRNIYFNRHDTLDASQTSTFMTFQTVS